MVLGRVGNVVAAVRRKAAATRWALGLAATSTGCVHVAPPASGPPTADAALQRMHQTYACGNAVQASAKIDHF